MTKISLTGRLLDQLPEFKLLTGKALSGSVSLPGHVRAHLRDGPSGSRRSR